MNQPPMPKGDSSQTAVVTERFQEPIMQFQSDGMHVNVSFMMHAGIYKLSTQHKDFAEMMTALAKGYQKNIPVEVALAGMEIVELKLP